MNELPSVALTRRFPALCEDHGSERLAVRLVAVGRNTGVPGLPAGDDWTAWNADGLRAAVDFVEEMGRRWSSASGRVAGRPTYGGEPRA